MFKTIPVEKYLNLDTTTEEIYTFSGEYIYEREKLHKSVIVENYLNKASDSSAKEANIIFCSSQRTFDLFLKTNDIRGRNFSIQKEVLPEEKCKSAPNSLVLDEKKHLLTKALEESIDLYPDDKYNINASYFTPSELLMFTKYMGDKGKNVFSRVIVEDTDDITFEDHEILKENIANFKKINSNFKDSYIYELTGDDFYINKNLKFQEKVLEEFLKKPYKKENFYKKYKSFFTSKVQDFLNRHKNRDKEILDVKMEYVRNLIFNLLSKNLSGNLKTISDLQQKSRQLVDDYIKNKDKKTLYADAVVLKEGKILILYRSSVEDHPLQFCLAGGHVDEGEHPQQAAKRELEEETGLKSSFSILLHVKEDKNAIVFYYYNHVGDEDLNAMVLDNNEAYNYAFVDEKELNLYNFVFDLKEVLKEKIFPLFKKQTI